ncbi:unnamed protein product, partial [Prunus brigantina]
PKGGRIVIQLPIRSVLRETQGDDQKRHSVDAARKKRPKGDTRCARNFLKGATLSAAPSAYSATSAVISSTVSSSASSFLTVCSSVPPSIGGESGQSVSMSTSSITYKGVVPSAQC